MGGKQSNLILYFFIYGIFLFVASVFIIYLESESRKPENRRLEPIQTATTKKVSPIISLPVPTSPIECPSPKTLSKKTKIQEVTLYINDSTFIPNYVSVPINTILKITLHVQEGFHNFVIDDFGIYSEHLTTGKQNTFSFFPCVKGQYRFYSNDSKYENLNIEGKLIVE